MKAESQLRSAGVFGDLRYKPDIFAILGIYRNNAWGIRPSIYLSKMARNEKKSKITVCGTGRDRTGLTFIFSHVVHPQGSGT